MPDDTKEQAKLRRKAMREASKKRDIYSNVAAPYLSALRTLALYEGYNNLDLYTADYDDVVNARNERFEQERIKQEKLKAEREFDRKSKQASRKLKK